MNLFREAAQHKDAESHAVYSFLTISREKPHMYQIYKYVHTYKHIY